MSYQVTVSAERCGGCEECVDGCTAGVFNMADGKCIPANMEQCLGCETCVEVCPEGAITVTEV